MKMEDSSFRLSTVTIRTSKLIEEEDFQMLIVEFLRLHQSISITVLKIEVNLKKIKRKAKRIEEEETNHIRVMKQAHIQENQIQLSKKMKMNLILKIPHMMKIIMTTMKTIVIEINAQKLKIEKNLSMKTMLKSMHTIVEMMFMMLKVYQIFQELAQIHQKIINKFKEVDYRNLN